MTGDLRPVLDGLATVKDAGELILLEGYLVNAADDRIRLVTGGVFLDFEKADIIALEERAGKSGLAVPVRLALRTGARPVRIGSSKAYDKLIGPQQAPFAISIRQESIHTRVNIAGRQPNFVQKERRFLRKYSLGLQKPTS